MDGFREMENILPRWVFKSSLYAEQIDPFIEHLCQLKILVPSAEGTFRFAHAMLRDVLAFHHLIDFISFFGNSDSVLSSNGRRFRYRAAVVLGRIGDERAVSPLVTALADKEWDVRRGAAQALGRIGDVRAVLPLIAALEDEDWGVRQNAAHALGRIGDTRSVEFLVNVLEDEDWAVCRSAAHALALLGDKRAVPVLITSLKEDDSHVRVAAARALCQIGTPEALEAVEQWEQEQDQQ
jgi:HEAT repeat protein